ncbi:MAG: hypothetical protein U5L45_05110 [Saprospiraceae bacterium]|nr:hypothetical protein [Saprospiraceae bacterium]
MGRAVFLLKIWAKPKFSTKKRLAPKKSTRRRRRRVLSDYHKTWVNYLVTRSRRLQKANHTHLFCERSELWAK